MNSQQQPVPQKVRFGRGRIWAKSILKNCFSIKIHYRLFGSPPATARADRRPAAANRRQGAPLLAIGTPWTFRHAESPCSSCGKSHTWNGSPRHFRAYGKVRKSSVKVVWKTPHSIIRR